MATETPRRDRSETKQPARGPGDRLRGHGLHAWALLGILALLVAAWLVLAQLSVVVVAFLLALFPAALMSPLAEAMRRRGTPDVVTALAGVLALVLVIVVPAWLIVPRVAQRMPELVSSAIDGLKAVEDAVDWSLLPGSPQGPSEVLEDIGSGSGGGGGVVSQGLSTLTTVANVATGTILMVVILFFCLKDGRRLWTAVLRMVPSGRRGEIDMLGGRAWDTLGAYLRGQLLIALFDAVCIGLGLWLLGVPLAVPLSVLVFFGALFPVVGSFIAGLLAVLVAFADQGLLTAGLVVALIVVVQQIEGNVFQPLVMSNIVGLHPLVVILSIVAGGILLGVLGAFIAVPFTAIAFMLVRHVGHRPESDDDSAALAD